MSQDPSQLIHLPATAEPVTLLAETRDYLLVDKPARLLSVPGRNPLNSDCVIARLHLEFPTAAIVHRLDYDTSGIMVVPLNKRALSEISRQFQQRSVSKEYQAVVRGLIARDEGHIDLPIAPDPEARPKCKVCYATGKPAQTDYRVLERDRETNTTRVALFPVTGRSHQLRLHLAAIGHPILGCDFYAGESDRAAAPRLLLHARRLCFTDPFSGQSVSGESALPF
ncbi:RluA family pseudouridine synthase [Marinimicrobium alkaliphilum]|uniref:RluA family pseudouridine synthase n=1 Tax=Marinimicrobium alkaliphilum TaxID=2202654 RepID=UPI000DBA647D|nr:RluA family pseudouridine synthase [Marinimicrobium alkaliphilum]